VGRRSNRTIGWIVLAAVALLPSFVHPAALVDRARLREGPAKDTKLLGWVEAGVTVEIESERNGWYSVRTPDGQSGYVWKDHLRFDAAEPTAAAVVTPTTLATAPSIPASGASAPSTVVPVAELRTATVDRPDGVAVELQHLRTEVARLATAQQELTQRLAHGGHEGTSSVPISTDGSAGAAVVFFAVGIFVGWIVGRFTAGRRDRRSRIRL
jgi:uncharacterized protein YgiM (DUF1202 family)